MTNKVSIEKKLEKLELKKSWIKERPGPNGMKLSYMDGARYITLLNEVVGFGEWDWTVGEPQFTTVEGKIKSVYIKGTLHVQNLGVTREAWGTHDIKKDDIANGIKSAETDALKRACKSLNIGLQLYSNPEARKAEKRSDLEEKIFNRLKEGIKNHEFSKADMAKVINPVTSEGVLDYIKKNDNDVEKLCNAIVKATESSTS